MVNSCAMPWNSPDNDEIDAFDDVDSRVTIQDVLQDRSAGSLNSFLKYVNVF